MGVFTLNFAFIIFFRIEDTPVYKTRGQKWAPGGKNRLRAGPGSGGGDGKGEGTAAGGACCRGAAAGFHPHQAPLQPSLLYCNFVDCCHPIEAGRSHGEGDGATQSFQCSRSTPFFSLKGGENSVLNMEK